MYAIPPLGSVVCCPVKRGQQMQKLYITEPGAINMHIVHDLLANDWDIVEGDPSFSGDIADCSALLIRSETIITNTIKQTFPALEHIIRVGVGVDNIDMDFCNQAGIAVYNAPGANADAVSDYVVGMMLHVLRKTHQLSREDVEQWNRFKFTGRSMAGQRVGIVGFGNIGRQIFSKLQGFHCKAFFVYDPFVKKEDLPAGATYATSIEEVLKNSDIITLHVPLLPTTKYLINKDNLGLMPDGAVLINSSRGGIVKEADVVEYMRSHNLVYVADTVEGEPNVSSKLLDMADALVTPHIASLTKESNDAMVSVALDNFSRSRPMNKPAGALHA
jgi:phosphoglycerate dehydrogenase-like enzyme